MTPLINKAIMSSRPLFDPSPANFVAKAAVADINLRRVRLSDFVVVAFAVGINTGHLKKREVDIFENVYTIGAKVRKLRTHEGHPVLAPDGTIMTFDAVKYSGSDQNAPAGPWTVETVNNCEGYDKWFSKLMRSTCEFIDRGGSMADINTSRPSDEELATANAVVLKKMAVAKRERGGGRIEKQMAGSIENEVDGGLDKVGDGLDEVGGSLDEVGGSLDKVDGGLDEVGGSLDKVDGGLDEVDVSLVTKIMAGFKRHLAQPWARLRMA